MKKFALLVGLLLGAAAPASAAVNYSFTGYNPQGEVTTSFSYTVASFVTPGPGTHADASDLDSCTSSYGACGTQYFDRGLPTLFSPGSDLLISEAGPIGVFHYFEYGAFTSFGEHLASNPDIGLTARLIVSDIAPVPEPSEWAMMAAGLAVAGLAARRRQTA